MQHEIERRLGELERELEGARETLAELETRRAGIRSQMLRISGAIQVLEELRAGAPRDR
jgi:chromosome segregation ATPase